MKTFVKILICLGLMGVFASCGDAREYPWNPDWDQTQPDQDQEPEPEPEPKIKGEPCPEEIRAKMSAVLGKMALEVT